MNKTLQQQIEDILKKTDRLKTADAPEGNPFFPNSLSIEEASAELTELINNQILEELGRIYQDSSYAEDRTAKEVLDRIELRLAQLTKQDKKDL